MPRVARYPGLVKRGKTWYSQFTASGRQVRKALSTDLEVSKVMLRKLRMRYEAGEVDNEFDFDELVEKYFENRKVHLRKDSVEAYRKSIKMFRRFFCGRLVSDLTVQDALRYRQFRRGAASTNTIQTELDRIGMVLDWGVKNQFIGKNPFGDVDREASERVKRLPFTVEEANLIIENSDSAADYLYSSFATGLRSAELYKLRIEHLDFDEKLIHVPDHIAKTGVERWVPMLVGVYERLLRRCEGRPESDPVFVGKRFGTPLNSENAYRFLKYAANKAGVWRKKEDSQGHVTAVRDKHSTRRSFNTWLHLAGVPSELCKELMGHARSDVHDLYLSYTLSDLRDAISKHPWGPAAMPEGVVSLSHTGHTQAETQPDTPDSQIKTA